MKIFLFVLSFFLFSQAQAGVMYRAVDIHGKVYYSDKPIEDAEQLKLGDTSAPAQPMSYETRKAQQNFPVIFYSAPDCGTLCQQARDLLNKRGIPFTEKNLVQKTEVDEFVKQSGNKDLPAMTVGRTWVKGFLASQWDKELDFAGYPKTAPYGFKPSPAPATTQPAKQ